MTKNFVENRSAPYEYQLLPESLVTKKTSKPPNKTGKGVRNECQIMLLEHRWMLPATKGEKNIMSCSGKDCSRFRPEVPTIIST